MSKIKWINNNIKKAVIIVIIIGIIAGACFACIYVKRETNKDIVYEATRDWLRVNGYSVSFDKTKSADLFESEKECIVVELDTDDKLQYWFSVDNNRVTLYSVRNNPINANNEFIGPGKFQMDIIGADKLYLRLEDYAIKEWMDEPTKDVFWIYCDTTFSYENVESRALGKQSESYYMIIDWIPQKELLNMYNKAKTFEKMINDEVLNNN